MLRALPVADFLQEQLPVADVRSPGEFERGHLPGAVNLPLFSDHERAVVGTLYKQRGREAALLEGLRLVGPKLAGIVEAATALAPERRIRVHCWRGGERSGSVAWLLDRAGFDQVITLKGGYKSFRNHVLYQLAQPRRLEVIGGYTGSGKTELLHHLAALGEQVVDLEALAAHKGSSFGGLGQGPQPRTEQFENMLWAAFANTDPTRITWVEDESIMIGRVKIPDALFLRMRQAHLHFIEMEADERAERSVADYGDSSIQELAAAMKRIERRLGPQHCKAALEALEQGDKRTAALIALRYYDKAYAHGAAQRDQQTITRWPVRATDLHTLAQRTVEHARNTPPR